MIVAGPRVRWDSVQRTFRAHESVGILFHPLQPVREKVAFAPPDLCVFIQIPMILGILGPPGGPPGASGRSPEGLLEISWGSPGGLLGVPCLLAS